MLEDHNTNRLIDLIAHLKRGEARRHEDAETVYLETIRNERFSEPSSEVSHED